MTRLSRLLLPAIFLISACTPLPQTAGGLPFNTIEQKKDAAYIGQQQYNALDPGLIVLFSREDAAGGGDLFSEAARRKLDGVNWQTQFVVAVFHGWKPSGGYGVNIERITMENRLLTIEAGFSEPGSDPPGAVTSPYQLVVLGRPPVPPEELMFELVVAGQRVAVFPEE